MLILEPYGGRFGNKMLQLMNVLNEAFTNKQQLNLRSNENMVVIEYAGQEITKNLTINQVFQRLSYRLNRVHPITPI